MTVTSLDCGVALGSGEVQKRYLRRGVNPAPELNDIPAGAWAEKPPNTELWDIVKAGSEVA